MPTVGDRYSASLAHEFGALVRRLRYAKGLSQEGLAEAAKLERAYVGMIERGETNPSLRTVFRLARALGTTLAEMLRSWSGNRSQKHLGR